MTTTANTTANTRRQVCNTARLFFAYNPNLSWSVCMKLAWVRVKALELLRKGECSLTFKKVDKGSEIGEICTRKATSINSGNYEFKGSTAATNPNQVKFFDLEKNAPRSFVLENLISIESL